MAKNKELSTNITLEGVIQTALKIPGVKVNRETFLREQFKDFEPAAIDKIVALGPIKATCSQDDLHRRAHKLLNERTLVSTGASFLAGMPGGIAMAATIPADIAQFYGVALRMAQELAYLYGEPDLWSGEQLDSEKVQNQLILYCGVMLGVGGAEQAVRVMTSALAKQAMKKLPQKALTKTFYYPIVKGIAKFFGVKMTKDVFAKGVSKALPVIGGVISGGLTFASMRPMGTRLINTLEEAHFDYTQAEFEADWKEIVEIYENPEDADFVVPDDTAATTATDETADFTPTEPKAAATESVSATGANDVFSKITQAKQMLDAGILSEEEFAALKAKLIAHL